MYNGGTVSNKQLDRWVKSLNQYKSNHIEYVFPTSYFANWAIPINKFNPNNVKKVIFNPPATVVIFKDGSKEVVKCSEGDTYSPELGFAQAMMNVMFGSRSKFTKFIDKQVKTGEKFKNKNRI